jgi:hypothetical protein
MTTSPLRRTQITVVERMLGRFAVAASAAETKKKPPQVSHPKALSRQLMQPRV